MVKKSVDVRSKKDVEELETTIKTGPITLVLIYADWCGHCTRFKENVWNTLESRSHKANLASIHHDQLENTSLRDAKIRGYPSVLVVGKDGKPATFTQEETTEETNAMPTTDLETLEKIADADAKTIMMSNSAKPPDARKNVLTGGGRLLRSLMRYVTGKTRKTGVRKMKKGGQSKKNLRR
jgi:thiol-disulfide isomerase/thioredoxin